MLPGTGPGFWRRRGIGVIPDCPRLLADWSVFEVQMDKPLSADTKRRRTAARRADDVSLNGEAANGRA